MICFFQHIKSMTKLYHSKSHWIWLKNKKVKAKICAVGNGTAPRHRKINPIFKLLDHAQSWRKSIFSSPSLLSILLRIFRSYYYSYQWSVLFLVQILAKNVTVGNGTSVTGHAFYFHFSLFLTLLSISKVKFCDFLSFYEFQQIIR